MGWESNESKWIWDGQKFDLKYSSTSYLASPINGSEIKLTKETDPSKTWKLKKVKAQFEEPKGI